MPAIAKNPGLLYVVATPIGNYKDITLRALEIFRSASAVVCEEQREGSILMKKLGIDPVELITLNEHNEKTRTPDIITRLWQGQTLALISDCGTPVFADPGSNLIAQVVQAGIRVVPIPGPSSLMAALSILDTRLDKFQFAGFLPREAAQRIRELEKLRDVRLPVILMDTPYRMQALLADISKVFGQGQAITLATNLTLPNEKIFRGRVKDVIQGTRGIKAEFILILHR
jgi:16S rRNA (cytidine1402-2'-O)-methyltransferase